MKWVLSGSSGGQSGRAGSAMTLSSRVHWIGLTTRGSRGLMLREPDLYQTCLGQSWPSG